MSLHAIERATDVMNYAGQGLVIAYRLDAEHDIVQSDGTTAATTLAHASLDAGLIDNCQVQFNENGLNLTITHANHSPEFLAFRKAAVGSAGTTTTTREFISESGVKKTITSSSGSSRDYVFIIYPSQLTSTDGQRCLVVVGTVAPETGSFTTSKDGFNTSTINVVSKAALKDVDILAAMHEPDVTAVTADVTVAEGDHYFDGYIVGPA